MDSCPTELFLASILISIGVLDFHKYIKSKIQCRPIDLAIWMTVLSFGVGPWIAFYYGHWSLPFFDLFFLKQAYLTLFLYLSTLLIVRKFIFKESPAINGFIGTNNSPKVIFEKFFVGREKIILFTYVFNLLFRLLLANNYGFLFSFANRTKMENLPYFFVVIKFILDFLDWGCLWWACISLVKPKLEKMIPFFILLMEVIYSFTQGRRSMFFILIVFLLAFSFFSEKKVGLKIYLTVATILLVFAVFLFPFFHKFRYFYSVNYGESFSSDALNALRSVEKLEETQSDQINQSNLSSRPLIIRGICDVLEKQDRVNPMAGQAYWSTFVWSIPAFVYPQKRDMLQPKYAIQSNFSIPFYDISSSWPLYGTADWGVWGGIISGVFLSLVLFFLEKFSFLLRDYSPLLSGCSLANSYVMAFTVENDPTAAFDTFRSIFILLFLKILFWNLTFHQVRRNYIP